MPPTAHTQLGVRVFIQETVEITKNEVNTVFNNVEDELNELDLDIGEIDISWYVEEIDERAYVEGYDITTDNNTVPLVVFSHTTKAIEDGLLNKTDPTEEINFIVEPSAQEDIDDQFSFKLFKPNSDDVIYSASAKGNIANVDRPLINEYVGIGGITDNTIENVRNRIDTVNEQLDTEMFIDSVETEYVSNTVFINTGQESMTGEIADPMMDILGNVGGLMLVGKIER